MASSRVSLAMRRHGGWDGVSLNPLKNIDPTGTILLPGLCFPKIISAHSDGAVRKELACSGSPKAPGTPLSTHSNRRPPESEASTSGPQEHLVKYSRRITPLFAS